MLTNIEKLYNNTKPIKMSCFCIKNMKKNDIIYYILLTLYIIFNITFGYLFIDNITKECYVGDNKYVNYFMLALSIFDNIMNILLLVNKYIYKTLKYFKLLFLILTIPVILLSYYIDDIILSNMICLYASIIIAYNVIINVHHDKFIESIENEEILINNVHYTNKNNSTFNDLV